MKILLPLRNIGLSVHQPSNLHYTDARSKRHRDARMAHLNEESLDSETLMAAQECREWLCTAAHFRSQGEYEYCDDAGLKQKLNGFLAIYAPQVKVRLSTIDPLPC